jgi:hypothetical protein
MNRTDYIREVHRQLENDQYYKKLENNPTEQFKKEIYEEIYQMDNISYSIKESLVPDSDNRVPAFYILPKIHKQFNSDLPLGYPGRPIVSGCGSLTEKISSYVDNILKPHMESLPSYVKDTTDFIRKIQNITNISTESFLVTMDVSSLYSNIPHNDGIKACQYYLNQRTGQQHSVKDILHLIEIVLTKNNFQFGDDNYIQNLGTAMGTKMAPSYASLFMGKFEMDFLNTCERKPSIWLRFLDDIFFIWDHSEEELITFFNEINNYHNTIKFTYNYSKTNATFLDVNLEKKDNCEIETSVHEKITNAHQYIEFSSCHPLSCKKGIPFSQAKRYRRITSNNNIYEKDCDKLRGYFRARNYPENIITDTITRASTLSREDTLKLKDKSEERENIIPFVCTYNPSLPNIGKIINQYWNLLKFSPNESVRKLYKYKPIVAYKRPRNLQDNLVHTHLNAKLMVGSVSKCCRPRCTHCNNIVETNNFSSTTIPKEFAIKRDFSCISSDVIYLITCKKCKKQYVGQTQQKCSQRMNSHKFDIKHFPDTITNVSEHFNSEGHSIKDFSFMPIDKVKNNWQRLLKETSWMYKLGTIIPDGMNSKILY